MDTILASLDLELFWTNKGTNIQALRMLDVGGGP